MLTLGAWAADWPGFRRSFGVIADFMVVTEPIPSCLAAIGWTSHVGIADGREMLYYLRRTDDDRIAIGGGATGVVYGARIGRGRRTTAASPRLPARGLLWLFPQLEGVRFTHAWGGPIDHTAPFRRSSGRSSRGTCTPGSASPGTGSRRRRPGARSSASLVLGVRDEWTSMPVVGPEVAKAPPEPSAVPVVLAAARALESGDRREDAGRPRGTVRRLIGDAPIRYRERLVPRGRGNR